MSSRILNALSSAAVALGVASIGSLGFYYGLRHALSKPELEQSSRPHPAAPLPAPQETIASGSTLVEVEWDLDAPVLSAHLSPSSCVPPALPLPLAESVSARGQVSLCLPVARHLVALFQGGPVVGEEPEVEGGVAGGVAYRDSSGQLRRLTVAVAPVCEAGDCVVRRWAAAQQPLAASWRLVDGEGRLFSLHRASLAEEDALDEDGPEAETAPLDSSDAAPLGYAEIQSESGLRGSSLP